MASLIDRPVLRESYEELADRLRGDATGSIVRPYVNTRLVRDVTVESSFVQYDRPFTFTADEAHHRGGHEDGPSPMRYFLSGIAFCQQGWYAKGAALVGVELGSLELDVRTYMDMRGEHGFEGVPPNPQWLLFEIRATSDAPAEDVLAMIDWGDARCPLGVLARKAVPVYERVTLNGETIRDTTPDDLP
jgi:uncharacterized OsmC-like protein